MAYCGPRGIPYEVFLEWGQDSQDAALSWAGYESRRDTECGHHPDEGPVHPHVDTCVYCAARDQATRSEEAKLPGAHVKMARGTAQDCERCQREAAANAADLRRRGRNRG